MPFQNFGIFIPVTLFSARKYPCLDGISIGNQISFLGKNVIGVIVKRYVEILLN